MTELLGEVLIGLAPAGVAAWTIEVADEPHGIAEYRALRREVFVREQGLFATSDHDDVDDDPRTVVLLARAAGGELLGGVRLSPATSPDLGWWTGGRLAVARAARSTTGIGAALVRAACAHAEQLGAIRFDATVQAGNEALFLRLGWLRVRDVVVAGTPHVLMRWPVSRFAALASATKAPLGGLLAGLHLGGAGFVGDDGAPVPGSDLVAACDAIVPAMVERDPEWAGWCGVLVNVNDLAAMGAAPVGLLDAIGARDTSFAARVVSGLREASQAWGVPVLGGHTQFGVPASLSVTALGQAARPIPSGGGRPGEAVTLTADLAGSWRRGYTGRQWDSTTSRTSAELQAQNAIAAHRQPSAAKDVSMAGVVGTLGMLAESSGCGAVLDIAAVPRPDSAAMADWLTCFPGFALLTSAGHLPTPGEQSKRTVGGTTSAVCGELTTGAGVSIRWPDGELTDALPGAVTGLGAA